MNNDNDFLLQSARALPQAQLREGIEQRPNEVQSMTIDLSTARSEYDALPINFAFRSIFVRDAYDTATVIKFRPNSNDTIQSAVPLYKNDSMVLGYPMRGFLHWEAQSGKTITILFFATAEFRSGSQISVTGGGVSIIDGSSLSGPTTVSLSATTTTMIAPVDSTRKKATFQNSGTVDLYIGGSTVTNTGANKGIKIVPDQIFYWQNTTALYGYCASAGSVVRLDEA